MSRVLITGASGFLGWYLLRRLRSVPGYDIYSTYHRRPPEDERCHWYPVDVANGGELETLFRQVRPDVVVHLAAVSSVEEAERSPQRATEVNVGGTEHIARLCNCYNARLVFLSTDYVFSGDRGRYREDEAPSPAGHYGRTKWEAEQAVARHLSHWSVVRTTLVYGQPQAGCHGNLASLVIERLEDGQPFYGHTDTYRTPTYVEDIAEGIVRLVRRDHPGTYHVAGTDWINMYDFARAVAAVFDLDAGLVRPALAAEQAPGGRRPKLLGLDSARSTKRLGICLSGVACGLRQMLDGRGKNW